jgi:maleylpyruvate isomerase
MQQPTAQMGSSIPRGWLDGCIAAHRRVEAVVAAIPDATARQSTRLEGWSVGHILTHLARNADAHSGIVEAAQRGEIAPMYPGGRAQRDGAIDAGQGRPAAALIADLRSAHERLERAWAATSEELWATGLGQRATGPATLADFVFSRWREVEVHLMDLDLAAHGGPDWDGLSAAYVDLEWPATLAGLAERAPEGVTIVLVPGDRPSHAFGSGPERAIVRATPGRLLGWLFGRGGDPAWPVPRPWSY